MVNSNTAICLAVSPDNMSLEINSICLSFITPNHGEVFRARTVNTDVHWLIIRTFRQSAMRLRARYARRSFGHSGPLMRWVQTPVLQPLGEEPCDLYMAGRVGVLVIWEYVGKSDPASCIYKKYIFVSFCMSCVNNLLVTALIILAYSTVRVWPAPWSKNKEWLTRIQCSQTIREGEVSVDKCVTGDILGGIIGTRNHCQKKGCAYMLGSSPNMNYHGHQKRETRTKL